MLMKFVSQDKKQITIAKSALVEAGFLKPTEGKDVNVVPMAQTIVNKAVSGVVVKIISSSNSHVASDGTITYGNKTVTGGVTFGLSKGKATNTLKMSVTVPKTNLIVPTPTPDPTTLVNIKDYGAVGDGVKDDTGAIQKAVDYVYSLGGGTVNIPDGMYLIDADTSIWLKSNISLNLSTNAILKAKPSANGSYVVVRIKRVSNVSVVGGSIIGERDSHLGTSGEWGMGIRIDDSMNITVTDISISNCWGDGIFVGTSASGYCQNVTIERFNIDNCRRNGISVVSAKDLIVRDGTISNIHGTEPQAGIDLEPDFSAAFMQNTLFENVQTKYCGDYGFLISFTRYMSSPNPSDVTIKNFSDIGSVSGGIRDYVSYLSSTCKITVI